MDAGALINFLLRSSLLVSLQHNCVSLLTLTTKSQHFLVGVGESVQIPCEFRSNQYTAFTNPIIWKKFQNAEETAINIMGNILDPLLLTNRFTLSLVETAHGHYKLSLRITDLSPEDSGNYSCEIRGPKSVILARVVHSLSVITPVFQIYWEFENSTDEMLLSPDHESRAPPSTGSDSVFFIEGVSRTIRCVVVGGYPLPETTISVGDRDITEFFGSTYSVSLDGDRGLRVMTYRSERIADDFAFTVHDDGLPITCAATVPGYEAFCARASVSILHRPLIACHPTAAFVGDRNVSLRCEVRARPHLVALFWIIDGNGTTLADGNTYNEYWTMVVDRSDGVLETRLFMKQVFQESFKRYTLIAENVIAVSMSEAQLIKGGRSAKDVFQAYPPGSQARNDERLDEQNGGIPGFVYSSCSSYRILDRWQNSLCFIYRVTSFSLIVKLTQMTSESVLT